MFWELRIYLSAFFAHVISVTSIGNSAGTVLSGLQIPKHVRYATLDGTPCPATE